VKNLWSVAGLFFSAVLLAACGGGAINSGTQQILPMGARPHGNTAGALAAGYKQLYVFKGTPDGASPYSGLVAVNGTLYGTTLNGSTNNCSSSCGSNNCYLGCGTIFSVDTRGREHVIYDFKGNFNSGADGSWPFDGLTVLNGNQLWGTTSSAGQYLHGTAFITDTSGNERVVYSFMGGTDSEGPEAGLIANKEHLYGASLYGGGSGCGGAGCGVVYWLTTTGKEFVLYKFQGGTDGVRPYSGPIFMHDALYGSALFGGGAGCGSQGCGIIYKLNLHGKETVLHRFADSSDGAYPNGLIAVGGTLYGTTEGGGTKNSGTFFSITPSGKFTTLYDFLDIPDGNLPGAVLIYSKGEFYGTTVGGGTAGVGTVFSMTKTGSEKVIYSFLGGSDGSAPQSPVYLFKGNLYGTTLSGGNTGCTNNAGCGTIYRVKP
jgi:uncharacterized repeat protein (TIGR03803 family)